MSRQPNSNATQFAIAATRATATRAHAFPAGVNAKKAKKQPLI
jgi:hypothetical protein